MSSYQIVLDNDILKVGFNPDIPATADRLVEDVEALLDDLISSKALLGGELLKIDGRMSLPLSYTMAHRLSHLYSTLAVFDPRLQSFVVVVSTDGKYQLGSLIDNANNCTLSSKANQNSDKLSFLLDLEADGSSLKVGFNSQFKASGDRMVQDVASELDKLIDSGQLKGKLLKIFGRASVLVSFVIAMKLAHCYGAIAIYEPKEGSQEIDRYIVAISHSPDYYVGQKLDFSSERSSFQSIKIAICGYSGVGKTVFRDGLKSAIRQNTTEADDFLYVVSGCPDGDYAAWIAETAQQDPDLAKQLRKAYQALAFTDELAKAIAKGIEAINNPLLLFDVGGRISPENRKILAHATHAIILAKSESEIKDWQEFCQELNLVVLAIIKSDHQGKVDKIDATSPVFKGSVHYLERGVDVSSRPIIQALAKYIIGFL